MAKNGLLKFMEIFPNEQSCIDYFEQIRWNGNIVSPFDETSKVYKCRNGKYKCSKTKKYFDVKTGTVFAKTKMPLRYWFYAMFLFLSHKRGVSSCQLARDLGITQKTAWNMLDKIREYMGCLNKGVLDNEVEIDETFVGGKNKNRHKNKKVEKCQGRCFKDKVPVFGVFQRGGNIVAKTVTDTKVNTLSPLIDECISEGSKVFTDGWDYGKLNAKYEHYSVDHGRGFYGTTYVDADGVCTNVYTNGIECAWSQLKRTILGTYYKVSKTHLQKYIDEFVFRYNTRIIGDKERFDIYLQKIKVNYVQ